MMKVLMYGWQYPPKMGSTANLAKIAQDLKQTDITFVATNEAKTGTPIQIDAVDHQDFAHKASQVIDASDFDILHAHDYPSFLAALAAHEQTQKPLIIHANETTFDRHEGLRNEEEFALEKKAFESAHKIVAGNNRVRDRIVASYKVDENKIVSPDNLIDTYKHAKNSYVLSGKRKETVDSQAQITQRDESPVMHEHVLARHHNRTLEWMRFGLVDFLVGLGIGFLIALFLLAL